MTEVVRRSRHALIEEVLAHERRVAQIVYGSATGAEVSSRPERYIKVTCDLEWPRDVRGRALDFDSAAKSSVVANLYRVQSLLERLLLKEVKLVEIRLGCVQAKFSLPESVSEAVARMAVGRLLEVGRLYSVTSVDGNYEGRAIRFVKRPQRGRLEGS